FRKLGVENIIQIKFRDDSLSWFPVDDLLLENVVKTVCRDGIEIAGRKFIEFGGSSSLFREHGTYFYATDDKNEIVEKWKQLGEFKVEAAAKVQARLGQYFTSARTVHFKLRLSHVALIDDYMSETKDSAGQPYCFSDGCGMIDPLLARRIADELQLTYIPSAFQFRFAGFK
uniref:RNA-dependent RNA polymerase n=1 Tax=Panagrolaimus sp. PS1159 TaxID=55785 RepID=A0AC35GQ73_9BILA